MRAPKSLEPTKRRRLNSSAKLSVHTEGPDRLSLFGALFYT